jgi:hypothetical protein
MKSIFKINCIGFVFILFLSIKTFPQEYPNYGSEEWKSLSIEQQKKSLQIPVEKLKEMSSAELIQAYLNFPLTPVIDAHNNKQKGFQIIYDEFNGLRELMDREDAATSLIKFYQELKPDEYEESWDLVKKGEFTFRIAYVELLLGQDVIIGKLKEDEVKILLKELLKKMDIKNTHFDLHSGYGLEATAFPMSKIIFHKGMLNGYSQRIANISGINSFLLGNVISLNKIPDIIIIANDFLSNNK